MILSKTPLRMSFVGGGSDLPSFYRNYPGAVLSASIDQYIYLAINRKHDQSIRVNYSKTENVNDVRDIQHPLVREALNLTGIKYGIEIASMADIPSSGSGLGSSSSFTVGLLNALYTYSGNRISKEELAKMACYIEIDKCKEPIGKQDQYAAAFGGLNLIQFYPDESVTVEPVNCEDKTLQEFEDLILVFFTGRTRSASKILIDQSMNMASQTSARILTQRMVQLAHEMKVELEAGNLSCIGQMLDENWRLKTQLSSGISDSEIDSWYEVGMRSGACGGKLLGAGNGGYLLFIAPKDRHEAIKSALKGLKVTPFKLEFSGTKIAFADKGFNANYD
ncbi:GHMP kinase [Polynucleobacter paneuropaeus]|nr:GHMP kinase [Polynucleobacter paneuropaeus]